jgi:cell division septal protein FtsQ
LARRRSKFRQWAKWTFITLLILSVIGGAVYAIWFSSFFRVNRIDVEGASLVSTSTIAGPIGGNILFWKLPEGVKDMPELAEVSFDKDYANNRILITVKEREKFLIWCLEVKGKCFWADSRGYIFTSAPEPEGTLVVSVVKDYTDRDLNIGDYVLSDDLYPNLVNSISLLQAVGVPVDEMRIDDLKFKEATAITSNGPEIYFNLLENPSFGEGVLDSLYHSTNWGSIRYVDLTVENRAYYSQ